MLCRVFIFCIAVFGLFACASRQESSISSASNQITLPDLPGCTQWPAKRKVASTSRRFKQRVKDVDLFMLNEGLTQSSRFRGAWGELEPILYNCADCSQSDLIAYYERASLILRFLDRDYEAIKYDKKILAFSPNIELETEQSTAYSLATTLNKVGRYQEALEYLDYWESLCPTRVKTHYFYYRGTILSRLGRYQEAAEQVKKSIFLAEQREIAQKYNFTEYLGMLEIRLGNIVEGNRLLTDTLNAKAAYKPIEFHYPTFPRQALNEGVEGECEITFAISTSGYPEDVSAPKCSDEVFVKPSQEAFSRIRYAPVLSGGEALRIPNQTVFFTFLSGAN